MSNSITVGLKIALSYVLAGASYILYLKWPHYTGNSHIPFSGFPEFLLWSPIAPYSLFKELLTGSNRSFIGLLVFITAFVGMLCILFYRRSRA
jgi:hypothetical protein